MLTLYFLKQGKNAMLESPTGTGKTLCLLTSSLAWREYKAKQIEATQMALAEQSELFIEGDYSVNNLAANGIAIPRAPVIIYASRTHSQLSQVVSELHRTTYASSLNICVLGSRSQMCIHPTVSQVKGGLGSINRTCTAYVKKGACSYHATFEHYPANQVPKTKDIEDLVAWGRRQGCCPFFTAKRQQETADIVFVPYNYIIDPLIRRSLAVSLRGAIVILDEAHNLETVANDAASFELSSTDLKLISTLIQQWMDAQSELGLPQLLDPSMGAGRTNSLSTGTKNSKNSDIKDSDGGERGLDEFNNDDEGDFTQTEVNGTLLKRVINDLLKEFPTIIFPAGSQAKVFDGRWIYEIFEKVGINGENAQAFLNMIDKIAFDISESSSAFVTTNSGPNANSFAAANALSSFAESLRKMFMTGLPPSEVSLHFKAVLQRESTRKFPWTFRNNNQQNHQNNSKNQDSRHQHSTEASENDSKFATISTSSSAQSSSHASTNASRMNAEGWSYKLSLWCFYPGLAMKSLMATGIRSLVVTSGTLSPLDSFAYELGIPFPIRLENPHVIPTSQIWVGVLSTSVDGETLNSAYSNRSSEYKRSLGRTLVNVARISPAGMLVFFPSYNMMEECIATWEQATENSASPIWAQMCRYKQPVIEPRESKMLKLAMKDYYDKVDAPRRGDLNGAIFLAVCRGKVSEGLDFSNQYGRTVVVTGLPFALNTDQKVKLKREYLDNQVLKKSSIDRQSKNQNSGTTGPRAETKEEGKNNHSDEVSGMSDKPLTGADWYTQSAWRAVNQAIGRVIRHRNDYGAIIFADERFRSTANVQLSKWLRPHVHTLGSPGPAFTGIAKFFATNAERFPQAPNPIQSITTTTSESKSSNEHSSSITSSSRDATKSSAEMKPPPSLTDQLTVANARRKSVFETLSNVNAKYGTEALPDKSSTGKQTKPEKAAQVLVLAKTQLSPEVFKEFQTVLKYFKKKQMKRSELLESLKNVLKDYPEFMATLREYMPSQFAEVPSSTEASKPSPNPSETTSTEAKIPEIHEISEKPKQADPQPASSLEIIDPPIQKDKKRPNQNAGISTDAGKEISSPKKFSPLFHPISRTNRPAEAIATDSLLDTSVTSTESPADVLSSTKGEALSLEILSQPQVKRSNSESLQIISTPRKTQTIKDFFSPSEDIRKEKEVSETLAPQASEPGLMRRASSDVTSHAKSDVPWFQALRRGGSGGNLSENTNPSVAPQEADVSISTPLKKKEKVSVDLITGQISSPSAMRAQPARRISTSSHFSEISPITIDNSSNQVESIPYGSLQSSGSIATTTDAKECPICAFSRTNFRTAPCGHTLCEDCWNKCLATKLECPFCRERVRVKKLEQSTPDKKK